VIFNQYGFVKATKTEGTVKAKEIQVQVNLDIPDKTFSTPQFVANLTIREDQLPDIVQELDMELLRLKKGEETEVPN
jgi:hypothetical protein